MRKRSKECHEAMKAAEVPGVIPATFENCGYQTYRTVWTGYNFRRALRRCFIYIRAEIAILDHDVAVSGYYSSHIPNRLYKDAVDFSLTIYLKKL
jgi:hypothetical protein